MTPLTETQIKVYRQWFTYDPQPNESYLTGTQSNETPYKEPKKPVDRDYYARTFGGKKRR